MTPEKTLRYLEHGYIMNPQEQDETAKYIRALQDSNNVLRQGMVTYIEELAAMRRELTQLRKELDEN